MEQQNEVFQQDFSKQEHPGAVFVIQLLMKEPGSLPDRETTCEVMNKHLQGVDCFWYDEKGAGFSAKKYLAQFKDATLPPQLMITSCTPFSGEVIDTFHRGQMWNCMDDKDRILQECKYQVFATDMLSATLQPQERAELDMNFMEALVELFPMCEAVYFQNSGKLFPAQEIREHKIPPADRFIYFAVNARFFNIQNTKDMMVDTVGMSTLFLPDLQYHFHDMDPNWVVNHAYNIASYIFDNDNPIKPGDHIDGMTNGQLDQSLQWGCQYEEALIQPSREVIDICMGNFASGNREEDK